MSQTAPPNKKRKDRSWLFLLLLLLILCLCLSTPMLARQPWGNPLKPAGDFVEQITCKVPQLASVGFICPSGGRTPEEQACGTACIAGDPNACPFSLSCKVFSEDASGVTYSGCWDDEICQNVPPPGDGGCKTACNPEKSDCASGLSCMTAADGLYMCWGETCAQEPDPSGGGCYAACQPYGKTCHPPPSTGNCNQVCNPKDKETCRQGLDCIQNQAGAYVCWNGGICNPPPTTTGCFAPCIDNATMTPKSAVTTCDPGLVCTPQESGGPLCWNADCGSRPSPPGSCYESCATYTTGAAVIDTCSDGLACVQNPNNGAYLCYGDLCGPPPGGGCNAPCVADDDCNTGLICQTVVSMPVTPVSASVGSVCWSNDICNIPPPTGGGCNSACVPNATTAFNPCMAGFFCLQEPDGGFVCWNAQICGDTPPPSSGYCGDPCNPQSSNCAEGTACVTDPGGNYVCWGQEVCLGGGTSPHGCNARCGDAFGECADGLTCVDMAGSGPKCWNANLCMIVPQPVCNSNGICDEGENCTNCEKDCGACLACGDGQCGEGEDCSNCSTDCGICPTCGNGHCGEEENCSICPQDCGPCCSCGDGACQSECGENRETCPADCRPVNTCTCSCTDPCAPASTCQTCYDPCTGGPCTPP